MEERLKWLFDNVNDWLKYAEAKSMALLAANGVMIFGILKSIKGWDISPLLSVIVGLFVVMLILSSILCAISFVPSLRTPWLYKDNKLTGNENLVYFEDIAKHTPLKYLEELYKVTDSGNEKASIYEEMLARQIITNSVIAYKKYKLFGMAISITIISISLLSIFLLLEMLNYLAGLS